MTEIVHDYPGRIARARVVMAALGLDALALSIGADLPYLTGYEALATERLTLGVVTTDAAAIVVPRLEAPRIAAPQGVEVVAWDETDDPIEVAGRLLGGFQVIGVGAQMWSRFLLGLQHELPESRFADATTVLTQLRVRKEPSEIAALASAGAAVDRVLARLRGERFSGRTERELSRWVAAETVSEGHDESLFSIVASGPNAASPHHEPGDRRMTAGDSVVVDFGGRWSSYTSDATRTFHVGEPTGEFAEAFAVLEEAQERGVTAAVAGIPAEEVDQTTRAVIADAGYGEYFIHRTGHGIGLDVHEDPYLVEGNLQVLEPGMAFSVEPGIYVPGRFGMRIEDIVVLEADGPRRLNNADRSLAVVE